MANWIPQPEEQPDGSYIFRLMDDVVLRLIPYSEKKQEAVMWRKDRLLPPHTVSMASKSDRDKLAEMAQDGFNDKEEQDGDGNVTRAAKVNVPNIEEDIGLVATIMG